MDIQAVLFDIDGTLVDSNEDHVSAWALAFREAGYPREADDIRDQIGKGGDLLVPALIAGVDDDVRNAIAERHGTLFKDMYLDQVRAFDGAVGIIDRVHASGRMVVLASSAERDELRHYVDLLGVADRLAATTSIDDVESSKPEPDIFGAALEKIGVSGDRAIVVGDTPYDIEAALRAGITAIGVTSGPFEEIDLKQAGAVAIYANVSALLRDFDRSPLTR